jgi:hypothetical protein
MKRFPWKHAVVHVLAASLILTQIPSALADAASQETIMVQAPTYAITELAGAQVKDAVLEKISGGWRIASVIKLSNSSSAPIRIPDYELRALGADGAIYPLQPSAANPKSIPAQGEVELSYMTELQTPGTIEITDLVWVSIDWNVYPKVETVLASAPIGGQLWRGSDAVIAEEALLGWGEALRLPNTNSSLQYTASSLNVQYIGQAPTYTLQVRVDNTGQYTETVPEFTISAKTSNASYTGKRMETAPTLKPKEAAYIHYAITVDPGEQLSAFYVLLSEAFVKQAGTSPMTYLVGGVGFRAPETATEAVSLPAYDLGSRIAIDELSHAVSPQMAVSLASMDWFQNEGQSYRTAVAKVKFTNTGATPVPVPSLGADLTNNQGITYAGNRSASPAISLPPGMSAISTVTFMIPAVDETKQFSLRLLEASGQNGYQSPIAKLPVSVRTSETAQKLLFMYPYQLDVEGWSLSMVSALNAVTRQYNYTYKVNMDVNITTTDGVVTDPANPKLLMQLTNQNGERVGYKTFTLSGDNRFMSGSQTIYFDNVSVDQLQTPLTLEIYETVTTQLGEAKRLLASLEQ